ncbi:MAG: hypothetical protein KDI55_00120 [Anaerolineae bacterium]|nr:hypothetical protein [Anaerolineae bacterium]
MIEPSDVERAAWPDTTRAYVEALEEENRDLQLALQVMIDSAPRPILTPSHVSEAEVRLERMEKGRNRE